MSLPPLWAMELVFWVIAAIMVAPLWLVLRIILADVPGWRGPTEWL